jgi:hypothetical protein
MNKTIFIAAILMTAMFASSVLADSTTLRLENKDANWAIMGTDGIYADLTFDTVSPTFSGTLTTYGLSTGTYALIYYADKENRYVNWGGNNPGAIIKTFTDNVVNLAIDVDLGMNLPTSPDKNIDLYNYCGTPDNYVHCHGAKIWIVPTTDLTSSTSLPVINWNHHANWLFETDLITYLDSDLPPIGYVNVYCTQPTDCSTGNTCVNGQCVPKVCGMTATGSIFFGSIVPGAGWIHSGDTTTVTNTGNIPVTPEISGANWIGSQYYTLYDGYWMDVGRTAWTTTDWNHANYLSTTPTSIGALPNTGNSKLVWYELSVPAQQPTDTYTQTITFTSSC